MDHTIVHFEIPANNVEKIKKFYENVFGWKIVQAGGPIEYWIIQTVPTDNKGMILRPGVNGGMYKRQIPEGKSINYYSVESITDFLEKIVKLGGKIIQPKQEVPEVGWIAAAEDPEGNAFALIEPLKV
ncbi:MAG: VOC family protein [Nitrososphaerota archaeon]|jgi:predicted enzyme related to lactoylglutathione lyase|uniref:VOC family protein n=1 Tax=Candidatus Bathycorpusculum sp. TaxID=2994959 RepID=UPI002825222A|nr:VOC family protein [Candidatus Termitimicrobium sp.]MCL2431865.1 VOC family protein [Candidatus Termitimicrobium sp.]MDR0493020.1 VOC family protein [Nitrososphaerota archaeon]